MAEKKEPALVFLSGTDTKIKERELQAVVSRYPLSDITLQRFFFENKKNLLVAVLHGNPVGFAFFEKNSFFHPDSFFVSHIFVVPGQQKKGIARLMVNHFYKRAVKESVSKVIINQAVSQGLNLVESIKRRNQRRLATERITEQQVSFSPKTVNLTIHARPLKTRRLPGK